MGQIKTETEDIIRKLQNKLVSKTAPELTKQQIRLLLDLLEKG